MFSLKEDRLSTQGTLKVSEGRSLHTFSTFDLFLKTAQSRAVVLVSRLNWCVFDAALVEYVRIGTWCLNATKTCWTSARTMVR